MGGLQLENGEGSLVGGNGFRAENGGYGMGGGYGSGSAADDDHDEDRMGGYGGVRHGMGGGYGGGSEGGVGGLRGGYGSEFGNGAQACLDELPSDYPDSVCYKQFGETSCEKIATDASHCGILWRDTGCSQDGRYVRDTCRKSCGVCKNSGHFRNLQAGRTGGKCPQGLRKCVAYCNTYEEDDEEYDCLDYCYAD